MRKQQPDHVSHIGPTWLGGVPGGLLEEPQSAEAEAALSSAFDKANEALKNPDCAGLFASPRVMGILTMTASSVLNKLKDDHAFRFSFDPAFPFKNGGVTSFNSLDLMGVRVKWSASIVLDGNLVSNPTELMLTVIHELGHVLRALGFRGGDFNDNDGPNEPQNQAGNNTKIRENCLQ